MIRGIYSNAQAMSALMAKQDVQANNLANVNTHGFKKDRVIFDEFQEVLRGQQMSTPIARTSIDPKPGTLSRTDNTLDLAIQGDGFFAVETPQGTRYTRNGGFQWNDKGQMVDSAGRVVLGTGGPIVSRPEGGAIGVGANGTVTMGGEVIGQLNVVEFGEKARLKKVGESLFEVSGGDAKPAHGQVIQGFLEGSSVNSVQEMADMISTLRLFEANQRSIKYQDEALGKAISELGR
ncbi:MAG: flagellar basal-body rod protein FlgF [Elusimicrobia bacterium]|nr:flagellar basal-body rod protein FlgF [Elusimicrobiota bacterium]